MDFYHDARDWRGGSPYESISKRNVLSFVVRLGFKPINCNVRKRSGLFGSGCDEYLFKRLS
jgi:2-polyprenyl-6-hydroxyphenyl methylase/3-demethylubiquinone-9 3-methyltransferase